MAKNEVVVILALLAVSCTPKVQWKTVPMDGHRSGVVPLTAENVNTGLGYFTDSCYVMPSGATFELDSPAAKVAGKLMKAQERMAPLKTVIGHSARMMMNDRDNPDLPLGNLIADILKDYGSNYFGVPMDFAITNFGGIRVPMPEGAVTMEDISSMFPFKNYMCYCKMKGEMLTELFNQLSGTKAFQATSGAQIRIKKHELESALVGGKPIEPERIYNVCSIDFLLDGGDKINLGALAENVTLSHVLIREAMLDYVKRTEAEGKLIEAKADGRVVMEE